MALGAILAPVLYGPLGGNPRRLKRFLNAFWIRSSIARTRRVELEPAALAKLMVLEELHRDRFAELITWSAEGLLANRLTQLEGEDGAAKETWVRPELTVWAKLHPPLAELNLVPYMQLAASLSQLTFETSGLRAELQAVLARLTSTAEAQRKSAAEEAAKLAPEDRQLLLGGLVDAIRQDPDRQGDFASSFGDDGAMLLVSRPGPVRGDGTETAVCTAGST